MKPPNDSRSVLTWQRDTNGNNSWVIDVFVNGAWSNAQEWECEVLHWRELPDPPGPKLHSPAPCGDAEDCSSCSLRGKCEWVK